MPDTSRHLYALSIGSNQSLSARLTPPRLLAEAICRIETLGGIRAVSPTIETPPLGPSRRRFANAALLVDSALPPLSMLAALQGIETSLGRRRFRRWGARRIDIDIILWSGGRWHSRDLIIPHPAFAQRDFVLRPLATIAGAWRTPPFSHSVRQLLGRLQKAAPLAATRG